jgi:hypothetical protein
VLTPGQINGLKDYIGSHFNNVAERIAFRSFDPPADIPVSKNFSDLKEFWVALDPFIKQYEKTVEADCRAQFTGSYSQSVTNILFDDSAGFGTRFHKDAFVGNALAPEPLRCHLLLHNFDGGGLFSLASLPTGVYYLTQFPSHFTMSQKLGANTNLDDNPDNHLMLDTQILTHEIAEASLSKENMPPLERQTICDVFSFAATLSLYGKKALPVCQAVVRMRAMNSLTDPEHATAPALNYYLRMAGYVRPDGMGTDGAVRSDAADAMDKAKIIAQSNPAAFRPL